MPTLTEVEVQAHGGSAKIVEFGDSRRAWCLHGVSFQAVAACVMSAHRRIGSHLHRVVGSARLGGLHHHYELEHIAA
jgi:hypothetical protein